MAGRPPFEEELRRRCGDASRLAVVGIGDELHARDRLGMLAAREVKALRLPDVAVFLAATVPESYTAPVRRFAPDHVLLLDAADMKAAPGTVAIIDPRNVRGDGLSTHALPLTVLMEYLESTAKAPVTLVGLQPDMAARAVAPTAKEKRGIDTLVGALRRMRKSRGSRQRRT